MSAPLQARHDVTFVYERSVGGATEAFLRGLARGEIVGSRTADGLVVVPPTDHDPVSGAPTPDLVPVSDAGAIRSWTWIDSPGPAHPLERPFAFALVRLDGADTALLHVVDVADPASLATGMRVRADWRSTRDGSIRDIRAFVPEATAESAGGPPPTVEADQGPLTVRTEVHVGYTFEPGLVLSDFYRALGEGRIQGGRCPTCDRVWIPGHHGCPACGGRGMAPVDLPGRGTVTSFTVVHLPVPGMDLELPFAWGRILLDGADVTFPHLLGDVASEAVHVGQRVEAVWAELDRRPASWEAIVHFRPVDP